LPVLIGVFAVSQLIADIVDIDRTIERTKFSTKGILMSFKDWKNQAWNMLRSSVIGTWIGILPGIGANIGSIVAYTTAKNMSKTPEKFGTGSEEGIVASEAANNATIGGALIPLIAMGIPGSVIDAILIGALMIHAIQPGPTLFLNNPEIVYAMISACLLANIMMYGIMTSSVGKIAQLMFTPRAYVLPPILVFCVIGSFALNNLFFDVWVMLGFGVFGYFLERSKVPLGPFVIGFVLAPIAESKLRSGLMMTDGDFSPVVTRPLPLIFVIISVVLLFWPFYQDWRNRKREGK